MFPLNLILVSGGEPGLVEFRNSVTELATQLEAEFESPEKLLNHWPTPPPEKRVIALRLRSPDDLHQVERVSTAFPGWPIVALVEGECDVESLYQISRAGAGQIVPAPFQAEDLAAAFSRILIQFGLHAGPSKLIAVSGTAEGCGATTLAINLADDIAVRRETPCILVELAMRLGRLANYLNVTPQKTTLDLLQSADLLKLVDVRGALTHLSHDLTVLVGPYRTVEQPTVTSERLLRLLRILRQLAPVVVVDMPYTFDDLYFQAMSLADTVVLVTQQNIPAIQAMRTMSDSLRERDASLVQTLVVNRFRRDNEEFSLQRLQTSLGVSTLYPIAYDSHAFADALNNGRVLREEASESPALRDIAQVNDSILGRLPARPNAPAATGLRSWFRRAKRGT